MTRPVGFTRGSATLEVLPDGRVLVTLAPAALPFGASVAATVLYASLRYYLAALRRDTESQSCQELGRVRDRP